MDADKNVFIYINCNENQINIGVEGIGFPIDYFQYPTCFENLKKEKGRGIFFIRQTADEVKYSERGKKKYDKILFIQMSVQYFNEDIPLPKLKKRRTSDWIRKVIISEGKAIGNISFIFCSDIYLLEVNRKYLNHDYFTDIITFDAVEGGIMNGDIFISIERVNENAAEFRTTFENELHRIVVHGVLHLLGYKDKNKKDKKLMTEKEDFYLKVLKDSEL